VAGELLARQAEIGELTRNRLAGMVGQEEEVGPARGVHELDERGEPDRGAGHGGGF
jgi:hypothetical protein